MTTPFRAAMVAIGVEPAGLRVLIETTAQRQRLPTGALDGGESLEQTFACLFDRIGLGGGAAMPLWWLTGPTWTDKGLRTAYLTFVPQHEPGILPAPTDRFAWVPIDRALTAELPSTDREPIAAAGAATRWLLEHTSVATELCPATFTLAELRNVIEAALGAKLDPGNFHRKQAGSGSVEPTGATTSRAGGRPAELYRAAPGREPYPFCHRVDLADAVSVDPTEVGARGRGAAGPDRDQHCTVVATHVDTQVAKGAA